MRARRVFLATHAAGWGIHTAFVCEEKNLVSVLRRGAGSSQGDLAGRDEGNIGRD